MLSVILTPNLDKEVFSSDFLVSEILVLVLLIPPLVRPFSKFLKEAQAIPVLPLFSAAVLCFLVWAHGLTLSFVPISIIVILCIITEIIRFVLFLGKVPNDFYAAPAITLRVFLLILLGGAFFSCFHFSPEKEYKPETVRIIKTPLIINDGKTEIAAGFYYRAEKPPAPEGSLSTADSKNEDIKKAPEAPSLNSIPTETAQPDEDASSDSTVSFKGRRTAGEFKKKASVLVIRPFLNADSVPSTVSAYLTEQGYTVIELRQADSEYGFSAKRGGIFFALLNAFFKTPFTRKTLSKDRFDLLISSIAKKEKPLYVFCEGFYSSFLADYTAKNPAAFEGVFYMLSEDDTLLPVLQKRASYRLEERGGLRFSEEIIQKPECVFIRKKEKLAGWGELSSEDIPAALLLGGSRDLGRKDRLFAAQTVEKWLELK